MEYIFVSCDIIGHSKEESLERQKEHIHAINEIVKEIISKNPPGSIIWASGGDGGHVGLSGDELAEEAINLLEKFRTWSIKHNVPLRVIANTGVVEEMQGADGRIQLVGHGINLAGRLIPVANQNRVVVTKAFADLINGLRLNDVRFHDPREVRPACFPRQQVMLCSISEKFESFWETIYSLNDRTALAEAIDQRNGFEIIYRARRLLQIHPNDYDAKNALRLIVQGGLKFLESGNLMGELFSNVEFGEKYIRGMTLLERKKGEVICTAREEGQTMFMALSGKLGGYLPTSVTHENPAEKLVDFVILPGELVGELALALNRNRTATLVCLEDTALLAFSYSDLLRSLSDSLQRDKLKEFLERKINLRILEHVCNSAEFLVGKRSHGAPIGPLAGHISPWLDLLSFFEIVTLDYPETKSIVPEDNIFKKKGVYILVSGKLAQIDDDSNIMEGSDEPILYADIENEVFLKHHGYRILKNVKIVFISEAGFFRFGVEKSSQVINSLKDICQVGEQVPKPNKIGSKKHVFLSYCHDNIQDVTALHEQLVASGERVWWDEDILGGADWKKAIKKAMEESYAIVICFSEETNARIKSGIFPEILYAIEIYREYAPGSIFMIPIRLSETEIPSIEVDATRTLQHFQHIDLFPATKRDEGFEKLVKTLKETPEHP